MTAFQAHMKKALGGGKSKGKTKAQRAAMFKAAVTSWKGSSHAGTSRPSRKSPPSKARRHFSKKQLAAQKRFAAMARARNVHGKSRGRAGSHRRRVGGQHARAGRPGVGPLRQSQLLETPAFHVVRQPAFGQSLARGDTHATPSPLLDGTIEGESGDPFVPRIADGALINTNELQTPLIRR